MKLKAFIRDFILSAFGVLIYNVTIQFLLYPYLEKLVGPNEFGDILSWISIIMLLGTTFGTGCNYSRMLAKSENKEADGNYIYCLLYSCVIVIIIILGIGFQKQLEFGFMVWSGVLACFTLLRYYSDVVFRLETNYKKFSLFYIMIVVGYLIGLFLYQIFAFWQIVFIFGECFAILFSLYCVKGKLTLKKNRWFKKQMQSAVKLSVSQFFESAILQMDRIMLNYLLTGEAVTVFYVSTLCGKIISLISVPLNGVIIGYLAKNNIKITVKRMLYFSGIMLIVTFLFAVIGVICSYILIPFLYPNIFDNVKEMLFIANLGQAFFFSSGICQVVILKYTKEDVQLKMNAICLCILCITGYIFTQRWDIYGMCYAVLMTTMIRFVLANLMGIRQFIGRKVTYED